MIYVVSEKSDFLYDLMEILYINNDYFESLNKEVDIEFIENSNCIRIQTQKEDLDYKMIYYHLVENEDINIIAVDILKNINEI